VSCKGWKFVCILLFLKVVAKEVLLVVFEVVVELRGVLVEDGTDLDPQTEGAEDCRRPCPRL
jgi:hypothetical protein